MAESEHLSGAQFYHGSPANLKAGDLISPGHKKNWAQSEKGKTYFTDSPRDAQNWGAKKSPARVYTVEPTGPHETDSNFPARGIAPGEMVAFDRFGYDAGETGSGAMSYQTSHPLRVTGVHPDYSEFRGARYG